MILLIAFQAAAERNSHPLPHAWLVCDKGSSDLYVAFQLSFLPALSTCSFLKTWFLLLLLLLFLFFVVTLFSLCFIPTKIGKKAPLGHHLHFSLLLFFFAFALYFLNILPFFIDNDVSLCSTGWHSRIHSTPVSVIRDNLRDMQHHARCRLYLSVLQSL